MKRRHRMPFGAERTGADTARFNLWAPSARTVTLKLQGHETGHALQLEMNQAGGGWFELTLGGVSPGATYRYRIDDELDVPDPAARYNPQGISGPSEFIDPESFPWRDESWRGRPWHETVLYELHVGTFTQEGTYAAMTPRLQDLADLGVNAIEIMPVATFAGNRGWGYDGVLPFAPHPAYGRPEDFKALIQAAHALGISVILDVVYNHFGPDGNYLGRYASSFFTESKHTPWGAAINFEGDAGRNVRRFFMENALYWLEEYHLDGLRLDAIHAIHDGSPKHFVDELADAIAAGPARERHIHLILENGDNEVRRLVPGESSSLLSKSQWNDDFHHPFHVLLTGESEGYYGDYQQAPLEQLGRVLAEGFAFQGEPFAFTGHRPRGEPSAKLPPTAFINVLQTHDQVGNRAFGERLAQLSKPEQLRAAMTVLLLAPQIPMLFMGEEYAAPQPFLYFCDHNRELAQAVTVGRRNEFARFAAFSAAATRERIPDPNALTTFNLSQLRWEERRDAPYRDWLSLTHRLLTLRTQHVTPRIPEMLTAAANFSVNANVLRVDWPLRDSSRLRMLLNWNATSAPRHLCNDESSHARLLHSSVPHAGGDLSPWEVRLLAI